MKEDLTRILYEDLDEEVLERMPEWFRALKEAHEKNHLKLIR